MSGYYGVVLTIPLSIIDEVLQRALVEDLSGGDVTSEACIEADVTWKASATAKQDLVVCGVELAERVFALVDPQVRFEAVTKDGTFVTPGAIVYRVSGRARSLLMAERTALNVMQRLSGVATKTRTYVEACTLGSKTRITDTRKTTPGLRAFERYAVRCGGGHNHRDNLGSAVLIKDNHVRAAGGVKNAIDRARERAPHTTRIECEVTTLEELETAIAARAEVILLDNMNDMTVTEAVAITKGRAFLEASGGITLERIGSLSRIGVDAISVGALTHSAPAVDISLEFE